MTTYDPEPDRVVRLVLYPRRTLRSAGRSKWGWRAVTANGRIVAVDGGQGYDNRGDAEQMAWDLLSGKFRVAKG